IQHLDVPPGEPASTTEVSGFQSGLLSQPTELLLHLTEDSKERRLWRDRQQLQASLLVGEQRDREVTLRHGEAGRPTPIDGPGTLGPLNREVLNLARRAVELAESRSYSPSRPRE